MAIAEQELLILTTQTSSVFSRWELQLETIDEGFYGYGYGTTSNFTIVGVHGSGFCDIDITSLTPSFSGNITGFIELGLGWEVGNIITVDAIDEAETISGVVSSYNPDTGQIEVSVTGHSVSISATSSQCQFSNPNAPSLDYFNVIGLSGNLLGYGYKDDESPSNVTNFESSYSYGWGYEYANFVFANSIDTIVVRARVLKDSIPQGNVRVFFWGSPGVIINPSSLETDSDGYSSVEVSINKDISLNQIDGWGKETQLNRQTPQVSRNLTGSGGRTVSAMIYEAPEIDDGNLTIASSGEQKIYSEVVFNLTVASYAFNEGEDL